MGGSKQSRAVLFVYTDRQLKSNSLWLLSTKLRGGKYNEWMQAVDWLNEKLKLKKWRMLDRR